MLRRSIVQFASRSRVPLQTTTQRSSYLSSRGAFYVSKNEPHKPDPGNSAPESQSRLLKIIAGGITLGFAYLTGYCYDALYTYLEEDRKRTIEYAKALTDNKNIETSTKIKTDNLACESSTEIANSDSERTKLDTEIHSSGSIPEDSIITEEDESYQAKDIAAVEPEKNDHVPSDDLTSKPAEESLGPKSPEVKPDVEHHKAIESAVTLTAEYKSPAEIETKTVPRKQSTTEDMPQVVQGDGTNRPSSLLDDYNLRDIFEELAISSSDKHKVISSNTKGLDDGYLTKDGKLVLDFLQAIHAAEERQAELDASFFFKEMKAMKEKYEKELKDARVRELMYAERESILDKELNRERVKAAAALKSLQENLEEKLKAELEQKETEVEQTLKKMQDIAKAELTAAIANEKASQIEKMAEANLNINALCMAFYARSEESRQSHSVHKLALGALALEYALSKGLPIKKEIEALHTYVEGIDKDSLVAVVLSSLPEDTQKNGTDTLSQLNHKFDVLKGTLRHFSLIPPGGGGILSHSLAHVASWLKVKESDQSGDGIESLINRVESLLAVGKLHEAADTLENGVKGSQAAEVVDDWVKRAKNRAITEQALTVLKSYATSISIP